MNKPEHVPAVPSEHFNRQRMLLAGVLDGLRFACASPVYLTSNWLEEKFSFSANGKYFSNSPYDYIQYWYLPLLRRGSTLPFFLVLDLGLSFLERDNIKYSDREDNGKEYLLFLERLLQMHESPAHALIHKIKNNAFQIQRYERQERVPITQQRTRHVFSRLCFNAVPVFIESLMPYLEQTLWPEKKYSLDYLRYSSFEWPLKGWDIDWIEAVRNPGHPLLKQLWNDYQELGMRNFNQDFFDALCNVGSQLASHKFSDVEKLVICTNSLDWANKSQSFSPDKNGIGNKPDMDIYRQGYIHGEVDLTLLSNYFRYHKLVFQDNRQSKRSFTKRTLTSNITKFRQPEGGFQEIGLQGQISRLLKSQLGLLDANPDLFYYKLYNHGLLYYMNTASRYRPMRMFIAVVVDMGPSTRSYLPELGYKNALARELAAYLIEDTCRYVGPLEGVKLDLSIQLCWPDHLRSRSVFMRFSDDHAQLLKTEEPFVSSLPEVFPFIFTLETAARLSARPAQPKQSPFSPGPVSNHLQDAFDAIRRRIYQETEIAFSEAGRRSSAIPYDCGHLAVIAGDLKSERNAPAFWREFFEDSRLLALARHSFLHQFVLYDKDVEWTTGIGEKSLREPYQSMREASGRPPDSPAVPVEASGSIRRGFVKRIIDEALRDRASFLA